MTKIYQSLTAPVVLYKTITNTKDDRTLDYGIKRELNSFYVYVGKNNARWKKIHGPFTYEYLAKDFIDGIEQEIKMLCKLYHQMKEEQAKKQYNGND